MRECVNCGETGEVEIYGGEELCLPCCETQKKEDSRPPYDVEVGLRNLESALSDWEERSYGQVDTVVNYLESMLRDVKGY